jgi:hypothetical protein
MTEMNSTNPGICPKCGGALDFIVSSGGTDMCSCIPKPVKHETVLDLTEREAFAGIITRYEIFVNAVVPLESRDNQETAARLKQILMDWRVEIILRDKF